MPLNPQTPRDAFLLALQFLTRLPIPVSFTPEALRDSPRWYPAVGIVVGLICALIFWALHPLYGSLLAAIAATTAGLLTTGALHEDGFADLCDGIGGHANRDRALEIMRDSRIGTYGAIALGLMIATRIATLTAMPFTTVPFALIAAHAISRASMLAVITTSTYARAEGAASGVADTGTGGLKTALATTLLALLPLLITAPIALLTAIAGTIAGHIAIRQRFERRLGGYTGDCLGAVQQCSELGFYLGLLAALQ